MKKILRNKFGILAMVLVLLLTACSGYLGGTGDLEGPVTKEEENLLDIGGSYTDLDDLVSYIRAYNRLPNNFIRKNDAKKLGWDSRKGNLFEVTSGKSIGGDRFGNYEGKLPKKENRIYYECDVNYKGGHRGPERLVYSNDGLIFYTGDHYETFEEIKD